MRPEVTSKKINHDELVPDPQVWLEFGVSSMTGWRWTHDPELDFPRAVKIRNRNYRRRRALEEFKDRMAHSAIGRRRLETTS
jgi:hypothetical protein